MGYRSTLDVVIQATLTELGECIREFHSRRKDKLFVWNTVPSIGKTLRTRLAVCNNPSLGCGDTPTPDACEWEWTIEALDVIAPEQAIFCIITASTIPGWVNAFGDVLNLNFWPDWSLGGSLDDFDYDQSRRQYTAMLLGEFKQRGMIQQLPEWLSEKEEMRLEIFVEEIDSFEEAKSVTPQQVKSLVPLDLLEDQIQTFLEEIIGENFHQRDWGGEMNDLVTSHVKVGGNRVRAAFILKGRGTPGKLTIADCGDNGTQIVRLVEAPVELYVIQHVDEIDQRVIYDLRGKVELKLSKGEKCQYCIIDGTDTARILRAYGKI
jgi:hypothetical protein